MKVKGRRRMIRPRAEQTVAELLEAIGQRLAGPYVERRGSDPALVDLWALLEVCQQQHQVITQWEHICHMNCPGTRDMAALVRAVEYPLMASFVVRAA